MKFYVNRIIAKVEKHAICVGEFVELRDPEEYMGDDPCDYVGVVVQVFILTFFTFRNSGRVFHPQNINFNDIIISINHALR